ncbi:MAG TPA: PilZ domain-containing protein [Elusimicrobiota bacterium]|nr:PilZ domain-containing protein [Elusimicrobiota bacterium]
MYFRDWVHVFRAHRLSREHWNPREAMLGRDRRNFQRVPYQVGCRVESRLFGMESQGSTVNLSMVGVQLSAPVTWPEGSSVRIHLETLGFSADGIIVYRSERPVPCHYGIRFDRIGFRSLSRLRRILRGHYKGPLGLS